MQHQAAQSPKTPDASESTKESATAAAAAESAAALDSGIGSSSEYDQDNSGNHLLQAQDDTSEASTDEGYGPHLRLQLHSMLTVAADTPTQMRPRFFRRYSPKSDAA